MAVHLQRQKIHNLLEVRLKVSGLKLVHTRDPDAGVMGKRISD